MQTPRTDLFPEALLVERSGQRIYTTSRKVAEYFGKNHFHVLRDIEKLLTDMAEMEATESNFGFSTAPNFGASTYTDSTGRNLPEYRLSHDGFALLAMGFTGREALRWKVAFLQAFRQHEADLADLQARYVAALDVLRPHLRTVVQDFEGGLPRSDTAMWLGKTPAAVTYHRSQARRLGLLPALAVRRVA